MPFSEKGGISHWDVIWCPAMGSVVPVLFGRRALLGYLGGGVYTSRRFFLPFADFAIVVYCSYKK